MKNCKVVLNYEKKGIELYFNEKPERSIIDSVKTKGFKWSNTKKCWYAKETEDIKKFAFMIERLSEHEEKVTTFEECMKEETKKEESAKEKALKIYNEFGIDAINKLEVKNIICGKKGNEIKKLLNPIFSRFFVFSVTNSYYTRYEIKKTYIEKESRLFHYIFNFFCAFLDSSRGIEIGEYDKNNYKNTSFLKSTYTKNIMYTDAYYTMWDCKYIESDEMKEISKEFDILIDQKCEELQEIQMKEYEEKQKIYEEIEKKSIEKEKKYYEMMGNINIIELDETKKYVICNANRNDLKCSDIEDVEKTIEEYSKGKKIDIQISYEIRFTNKNDYDLFSSFFMCSHEKISGKGGYCVENQEELLKYARETKKYDSSYISYDEKMKTFYNNIISYSCKCIAVYYNDTLMYIVDPEGFNYCRYVHTVTFDEYFIMNYDSYKTIIEKRSRKQLKEIENGTL